MVSLVWVGGVGLFDPMGDVALCGVFYLGFVLFLFFFSSFLYLFIYLEFSGGFPLGLGIWAVMQLCHVTERW